MKRVLNAAIFSALATMVAVASASARIGETLDQCRDRYGDVVEIYSGSRPDFEQYKFEKANTYIGIRLTGGNSGLAGQIIYGGKLTNQLVAEILTANCGDVEWNVIEGDVSRLKEPAVSEMTYDEYVREEPLQVTMGSADGRFFVTYWRQSRFGEVVLTIETREFRAAFEKGFAP